MATLLSTEQFTEYSYGIANPSSALQQFSYEGTQLVLTEESL